MGDPINALLHVAYLDEANGKTYSKYQARQRAREADEGWIDDLTPLYAIAELRHSDGTVPSRLDPCDKCGGGEHEGHEEWCLMTWDNVDNKRSDGNSNGE